MRALSPGQHVVIGLGNVGRAVAEQLVAENALVTVLTRSTPSDAQRVAGATHVTGELLRLRELWRSIPQASVIYNCANPRYYSWAKEWPLLTCAVNAFAQASGAVLATASNLYAYGPAPSPLHEDLPLRATFRNGLARKRSWEETLQLHRKGLLRATEVRASDFICTGEQSRMGDRVVPRVLTRKPVVLLGNVTTEHSWAFPTDVARSLIAVANDSRGWGRAWHVPSNAARTQTQVVNDIADIAGVSHVKVTEVPLGLQRWGGLVNPVIRELRDTNYQFARPFVVDSSAITTTFGVEATPWRAGLANLVESYRSSRSR